MFQFSLSELMLRILREYNEYLGLNNPPPTAQLYNALAQYLEKVKTTVENNKNIADADKAEIMRNISEITGVLGEESERIDALYNRVEDDENFSFSFIKGDTFTEVLLNHASGQYAVGEIYNQDAQQLTNSIVGSDTIVVDINENGDKLEIHLDADVIAKLDRALLTPLYVDSSIVLVGVEPGGYQRSIKIGDGFNYDILTGTISVENSGGGGGGSAIYKHTVTFSKEPGVGDPPPAAFRCEFINSRQAPYTNINEALAAMPLVIVGGYTSFNSTVSEIAELVAVSNGYEYNIDEQLQEINLWVITGSYSSPLLVTDVIDVVTQI